MENKLFLSISSMSQLAWETFQRRGRLLLSLNFLIICVMVSFCVVLVDVLRNPPSLLNPPPDQA